MFSFLEGLLLTVLGIGKNAQGAQHKATALEPLSYGADAVAQPRGGAAGPAEKNKAPARQKAQVKAASTEDKAALKTSMKEAKMKTSLPAAQKIQMKQALKQKAALKARPEMNKATPEYK